VTGDQFDSSLIPSALGMKLVTRHRYSVKVDIPKALGINEEPNWSPVTGIL
jgi:hypothetical protein